MGSAVKRVNQIWQSSSMTFLRRVNKLNPRKASGSDWISAELLQAGGCHTVRHIVSIGRAMVNSGKWAPQLAGVSWRHTGCDRVSDVSLRKSNAFLPSSARRL